MICNSQKEAFSINIASIADDIRWILSGKDVHHINEEGLIIFAKHLKSLHKSMCSYGIEYDDLGSLDYNVDDHCSIDILNTIESCMANSTENDINNFKIIKNFLDAVYEADRDSWWYGIKNSLKLKLIPFMNNNIVQQFLVDLISSNTNVNRKLYRGI